MQSIQRIHVATDSLEEKISSFESMMTEVEAQKLTLENLRQDIHKALASELTAI